MMKNILLMLLIVLPGMMISITRTVALDGSQQYTSIQAAVNASVNGDIVLIYPGRYVENITLNRYNITIVSLYSTNPQQQYIENTIIDGNLGTCLSIKYGETVSINGFTMVNNEQNIYASPTNAGGGIYIDYSSNVTVSNCIIRNCTAQSGGGIGATRDVSLSLSNVHIFDNFALKLGGGLVFNESVSLVFDPVNRCSIYNNFATYGMDINISYRYATTNQFEIYLNQGSVVLSEPEGFFIQVQNAEASVNIQQGSIDLLNHDLYVSPEGDDANDGLSFASPKKSITLAMQRLASNPEQPRSIYLAPGIYSHSENDQIFPLGMKSHTRIRGTGPGECTLDAELLRTFIMATHVQDVEVSGIRMINGRSNYTFPLGALYSNNIKFNDLVFENNSGALSSGVKLSYCNNVIIENVIAGKTTWGNCLNTFWAFESGNVNITNVVSAGNRITDSDANMMGFYFSASDLVLRNAIIANNYAQDAWPFFYTNTYAGFEDYNLDMSNILIANNTMYNCWWVNYPIYLQNRFQIMQINNCTFANNITNRILTCIFAGAEVRNLISYNPQAFSEITLRNFISENNTYYPVSISNSLFRIAGIYSLAPEYVTYSDNLMSADPMFLGAENPEYSVSQADYYQLSAFSPCIDSGTPDTEGLNLPPMDLAGNHRIANGRIDMGCYEYGSEPYTSNSDPVLPRPPGGINLSIYPNPILMSGGRNSAAFIEFSLPKKPATPPTVEIYNLRGQKVKSITLSESYNSLVRKAGLGSELKQDGEFYSTLWNCRDDSNKALASGTYLIRVLADGSTAVKKVTLIK